MKDGDYATVRIEGEMLILNILLTIHRKHTASDPPSLRFREWQGRLERLEDGLGCNLGRIASNVMSVQQVDHAQGNALLGVCYY